MMTLLNRYISQLPEDESRPTGKQVADSLRKLEKREMNKDDGGEFNPYYSLLLSITELFLCGTEPKRRAILLYGLSNTGKTSFMACMKEIFDGFEYRPTDKFAPDMRRRNAAPSLVVSDEWEIKHFNKANIDNTKRLFEGQGGTVEQKYVNPFIAFRGAYFLLSANLLHRILGKDRNDLDDEEKTQRGAFNARMKKHQFTKSYTNRDHLPFDAPGLALALKYLYDEFATKPNRPALPMYTQIENPDPLVPQNPSVKSEPSLNIRAAEAADPNILNAPLGKRPLPIQAEQDKDRKIALLQEQLEKKDGQIGAFKKGYRHLIKRRVSKSNPTSPEKGGKVSMEEIDLIVRGAGFDWSSSHS